jgi:Tfp pilus assembly protein PilP
MRPRLSNSLFLIFTVFAAAAAAAPDPQSGGNASADAKGGAQQSAPAAPYRYNADGRRDPFVSLLGTGGDSKLPAKRTGEGLAAMRVEEVAVRGIVLSRERLVAMVQGPDNKSYVVHQGDKLADGVVKSVVADGLVLVQQVSDPLSKEKTREVRKPLRAPNEGKE